MAIPVWIATKDPLWAVVLVTAIDLIGYIPTFRKSWNHPRDELAASFSIGCIKHLMSIAALESYTMTTVLYSASLVVANSALVVLLLWRRRSM